MVKLFYKLKHFHVYKYQWLDKDADIRGCMHFMQMYSCVPLS